MVIPSGSFGFFGRDGSILKLRPFVGDDLDLPRLKLGRDFPSECDMQHTGLEFCCHDFHVLGQTKRPLEIAVDETAVYILGIIGDFHFLAATDPKRIVIAL